MKYNFIKEISRITEMYDRHRKMSGEEFNIFSIMSMESDEVFTHSAMLAELLHPKGTHGLGTKPLELFVQKFLGADFKMNFENAVCRKEDHIGFTNADKTEGGRIDIVIKDLEDNVILIENKIYAAEQLNQLKRYKKQFPNAELFYLTLDGKESDQISIGDDESKIYRNLSYKDHIIEWISECAQLAFDKPMLREILNQYTFLLKKLTNQTTNKEMAALIKDIITDNFEASFEIYKNFEAVSTELKRNLLLDLIKKLSSAYPLLNFEITEFKDLPAILGTGFHNNREFKFRFKNNKLPVISFRVFDVEERKNFSNSFKMDIVNDQITAFWKTLPILTDNKLFPEKLANTLTFYENEIVKVINVIVPANSEAVSQ